MIPAVPDPRTRREGARAFTAVAAVIGAVVGLLLPEPLSAWGPGTHVFLGLEIIRSLDLLAAPTAALLSSRTAEFLYGCLAADIPMGKGYAPVDRHPHAWHVGEELAARARAEDDPALEAASLGYLSHLAADVVAHGRFVPRMLLLTSSTRGLGHSYWEHRMDVGLHPDHARLARAVVTDLDHRKIDRFLDGTLDRTLFSFETNRRIFRGMVRMADDQRWQSVFDTMVENSRWDLEARERRLFLGEAYEHMIGYLAEREDSRAAGGDPTGEEALVRAKQVRRRVLLEEGWRAAASLRSAADRFFPLPEDPPGERWLFRGRTPEVSAGVERRLLGRRIPSPERSGILAIGRAAG